MWANRCAVWSGVWSIAGPLAVFSPAAAGGEVVVDPEVRNKPYTMHASNMVSVIVAIFFVVFIGLCNVSLPSYMLRTNELSANAENARASLRQSGKQLNPVF